MSKSVIDKNKNIYHILDHDLIKNNSKIANIPHYGKLKRAKDGYVYVDVSNDFINEIFQMIPDLDARKPPYFTGKYQRIGAHISVISSEEADMIEVIDEIGEEIYFKLGSLKKTEPDSWDEMSMIWFVQVESEELFNFRKKYGLTPRLNDHDFHITVACKRRS